MTDEAREFHETVGSTALMNVSRHLIGWIQTKGMVVSCILPLLCHYIMSREAVFLKTVMKRATFSM